MKHSWIGRNVRLPLNIILIKSYKELNVKTLKETTAFSEGLK